MQPRAILFFLALLIAGGWAFREEYAPPPPPGIAAPEFPAQELTPEATDTWTLPGGYAVKPLANYHIHARVLGVTRYRYDGGSKIAPVDLALGWGRMSDWSVYGQLNITQRGRYYLYQWGAEGPPIPPGEIVDHSANNHIIPADDGVERDLDRVRLHDVLWMEGQLVEVRGPNGFVWRSSLTREDTGGGACELFRVTNLVIEPPGK